MNAKPAPKASVQLPGPATPALPVGKVRAGFPVTEIPTFADPIWNLTPLDHRENHGQLNVRWETWPRELVTTAKMIIWFWLNVDTPAALFNRAGSTTRPQRRPSTTYTRHLSLRRFFVWLDARGITQFTDIHEDVLRDYGVHIASLPLSRTSRRDALFAVTLAWAYAPYLPEEFRLPATPWDSGEDFTGRATSGGGENKVDPVHPASMSPLLMWAIRFVDDFSGDIFKAIAWHTSIKSNVADSAVPGGREKVIAYCASLIERDEKAPVSWFANGRRGSLAVSYIAGLLGVACSQVSVYMNKTIRGEIPLGEPASCPSPIDGLMNGRSWTDGIRFDDVSTLIMHLRTACLIVTTYLSGMRPEEVLHLRRGCCHTVENTSSGTIRHEIRTLHFKGVRGEDGNTTVAGEVRAEPWVTISPVARAITVLEKLSTGDFLWPRTRTDTTSGLGGAAPTLTANRRIELFIDWVNAHAIERGAPHEVVPPDPTGAIVMRRFRRTLAWFIYRLPGGRVALGVQYGHLRSLTSQGYGGRSRAGLHQVMAIEEARVLADNLNDAADALRAGDTVSGPAAERYKRGVTEFADRFEGRFLSDRQHRALLENPALRIYDHPDAALACVYDPARARCNPVRMKGSSSDTTPSLDRCQGACANIARTGRHVEILKSQIAMTKADIESGLHPRPIELRLTQRVATLEDAVYRHEEVQL